MSVEQDQFQTTETILDGDKLADLESALKTALESNDPEALEIVRQAIVTGRANFQRAATTTDIAYRDLISEFRKGADANAAEARRQRLAQSRAGQEV